MSLSYEEDLRQHKGGVEPIKNVKFVWAIVDLNEHSNYYYKNYVFVSTKKHWIQHNDLQQQYSKEEDKLLQEILIDTHGFRSVVESVFQLGSTTTEMAIRILESAPHFEHSYTMQKAVEKGIL